MTDETACGSKIKIVSFHLATMALRSLVFSKLNKVNNWQRLIIQNFVFVPSLLLITDFF